MLDMMHTERKVDVYGFVSRIRAQRCQMVQTDVSDLLWVSLEREVHSRAKTSAHLKGSVSQSVINDHHSVR
jgi:hypothetical protein